MNKQRAAITERSLQVRQEELYKLQGELILLIIFEKVGKTDE